LSASISNYADHLEQGFKTASYGLWAVFVCRLVPGIRSLISIPAGVARMKVGPFLLCSTLGAALWTTLLAAAGYALGANFNKVGEYLDPVSYFVFAGLIVFYLVRAVTHEKQGDVSRESSAGSA
jgi:membrane protein DedA with SNARE-associated domain